jgi:hypothetical protein
LPVYLKRASLSDILVAKGEHFFSQYAKWSKKYLGQKSIFDYAKLVAKVRIDFWCFAQIVEYFGVEMLRHSIVEPALWWTLRWGE